MVKSSNSGKKKAEVEKDWHYYLTSEAQKEDWAKHKVLYTLFIIIAFVVMMSIALINRMRG